MKNISLLPPEIKVRARTQQQQRYFLLGSGLVLILCLVIFGVLFTMTLHAESRLNTLQDQRTTIAGRAEGYKEYAQLQTRVQNIEGLAQRAVGKSPDWVLLMADVNRCLPPNVWMTGFSVSQSAELIKEKDKTANSPKGVIIQGWAADYSAVAQWLDGLYNVNSLSNVSCQYTKQQPNGNQTQVSFEITAAVRPETIPRATVTGGIGK